MYTKKFQWIDQSDAKSIKQARSHSQKEAHRAKKWCERLNGTKLRTVIQYRWASMESSDSSGGSRESSSQTSDTGGPPTPGTANPSFRDDVDIPENFDWQHSALGVCEEDFQDPDFEDAEFRLHLELWHATKYPTITVKRHIQASLILLGFQDHLTTSRRDPFGTYPIQMDDRTEDLVSHCRPIPSQ